jgi:hypothetical protein
MPNEAGRQTRILLREDWDFSDCPEKELKSCCYYEYVRETFLSRDSFERGHDEETVPHPPADPFYDQRRAARNFFAGLAGFPNEPWVNLCPQKRRDRIEFLGERRFRAIPLNEFGAFKGRKRAAMPEGSLRKIYVARVDWADCDQGLVRTFKAWLKANRPNNCKQQTGKRSPKDELTFLGAYRLLQVFDCWEKALEYSESQKKGDIRPMYRDRESWLRAKRNAMALLRESKKWGEWVG